LEIKPLFLQTHLRTALLRNITDSIATASFKSRKYLFDIHHDSCFVSVPNDYILNALALEARKLFTPQVWKGARCSRCTSEMSFKPSQISFCIPAPFLYRGTTIFSVFN